MVNIHKQFGGTGLGSMLSLDGIDCNAVYASEVEEECESAREQQFDSANELRSDGERGSQDGSGSGSHKHPQSIGLNPQSIGFSLDGRLSGVTSAVALRVSEIERASASTPALESANIKAEVPIEGPNSREESQNLNQSPRGNGTGNGTMPANAALINSSNASMPSHGHETGSGLSGTQPGVHNDSQIVGMKNEKFSGNTSNGHSYTKQMSISSHSAALIPSSSGYGNAPGNIHYHPSNVVPTPLSQVSYLFFTFTASGGCNIPNAAVCSHILVTVLRSQIYCSVLLAYHWRFHLQLLQFFLLSTSNLTITSSTPMPLHHSLFITSSTNTCT